MQVQRIQNNNYNSQFKSGFLKLNSPIGNNIMVHPEDIKSIVSKNVATLCLSKENVLALHPIMEHILKMTEVLFTPIGKHFKTTVNATESEILDAMNKAENLKDHEFIEVGVPLEYLKDVPLAKSLADLPLLKKTDLSKYKNTVKINDTITYSNGYVVPLSFKTKNYLDGDIDFLEESKKICENIDCPHF